MKEVGKLNPIDDIMFRKMAEEKAFCQEILRVILNDDKLVVLESTVQWTGTNLKGRSVVLDTRCILKDMTLVNIEVQKANNDDSQRRVRYNGAVLTTNNSKRRSKFKDIPNVTEVFISKFDVFKYGLPIYHIDRTVRETGEVVYNGFEEIYINSKARNGTAVSELMKVFTEDGAYSERFPVTSKYKKRYKETKGGRSEMCELTMKMWQDGLKEGRKSGLKEGRKSGLKEGRKSGEYGMLNKLIEKGAITPAVAAESMGIDEAELMRRLKKTVI